MSARKGPRLAIDRYRLLDRIGQGGFGAVYVAEQKGPVRRRVAVKIISLRGDLDWIVMNCLEKDRTRRYETANALAHDIARHLLHEPVVTRPPSASYRVRRFVRRNEDTDIDPDPDKDAEAEPCTL